MNSGGFLGCRGKIVQRLGEEPSKGTQATTTPWRGEGGGRGGGGEGGRGVSGGESGKVGGVRVLWGSVVDFEVSLKEIVVALCLAVGVY